MRYIYKYDYNGVIEYFSTPNKAFDFCIKNNISIHKFAIFNRWLNIQGFYEVDNQHKLITKIELR